MLITRLAQLHGDRLTETDRRIVSSMRERPHETAFARAVELTGPLGLHESAATRLAQRLGFEGYPQLRDALRTDYLNSDGPSQRVRNRIERTADDDLLTGFLAEEIATLRAVSMHVRQADLDAAADEVLAARRIHLHGQGNAVVLVEQVARRLTRFGLDVVAGEPHGRRPGGRGAAAAQPRRRAAAGSIGIRRLTGAGAGAARSGPPY